MDYPGSLDLIAVGQAGKEETANALFAAFSPAVAFGRRASTSSGLTWGYYGGVLVINSVPTTIANGTITLTDDATCYVRVSAAGVVDHTTDLSSNWPEAEGGYTALYTVTTASGLCTAWTDHRTTQGLQGPTGATGAAGPTGPAGGAGVIAGRLTLTSGTPVTTADVTAATSVYFTPFRGNIISLWDGAAWTTYEFTETTLALGTLTSDLNYDVFGYENTGVLALEMLAWTNDTTRATAVTLQDGRYCKSGDKTRLYLGTFRTTSTTTTEDSGGGTSTSVGGKRFLWNYYNRVRRPLAVIDGTDNWTYASTTIRQARATAGNKVEYVCGMNEGIIDASLCVSGSMPSGATSNMSTGIGFDSTTAFAKLASPHSGTASAMVQTMTTPFKAAVGLGYHYVAWLEKGAASVTVTFVGDNGGTNDMSGMVAEIEA